MLKLFLKKCYSLKKLFFYEVFCFVIISIWKEFYQFFLIEIFFRKKEKVPNFYLAL